VTSRSHHREAERAGNHLKNSPDPGTARVAVKIIRMGYRAVAMAALVVSGQSGERRQEVGFTVDG
jgi:hypothetical protein